MDTKTGKYTKSGRYTELDKYVEGFIKAYKKDIMDKDTFLSFAVYDALYEGRKAPLIGDKDWPYLHAKLEVPIKEISEEVSKLFDIDFYELSLHMNTMSPMHNAYCSLVENSKLVNHFIRKNKGLVKLDHAQELEVILKEAGVNPEIDGIETIGNAFGPGGIICTKDSKGKLMPVRYKEIPIKEFFDAIDNIEGFEILDNDSDDFYYELGDKPDYKKVLRNHTTKLVLSMLQNEKLSG